MQLVLIRHGKTDYRPVDERGLIGNGRDLAPLGNKGVRQAEECARRSALRGVELILSSPYTRALQTAAIISRVTQIPLKVEMDLREWQPDLSFQYASQLDVEPVFEDFDAHQGQWPHEQSRGWESLDALNARLKPVLDRYLSEGWKRLAVVAHGIVIGRLTGIQEIHHCLPYEVEYHPEFAFHGWLDWDA